MPRSQKAAPLGSKKRKGFLCHFLSWVKHTFPTEKIQARGRWELIASALTESDMHFDVIEKIRQKQLDPGLFYTHTMPFADFEKGFPLLGEKKAGKIVFEM